MKSKTPAPKSPEEIALELLRSNLALLSAESFVAGAMVYTHGDAKLGKAIVINSLNAIIAMAIRNVQGIRETLDKPRNPAPAKIDGS